MVTKGKTMIAEEIGLNPFLESHGIVPVETDLGEYIIQLADEPPSHIIAPAIHKTEDQVADLFHEHHRRYGRTRRLDDPGELVDEARQVLRRKYIEADVGITGANFLIAETGSTVIVTNEGNGDLTQTLPRRHIVLATPEKIVPTLEDAATLLRVLARSATGQEFSAYTTFSTGPRRPDDLDGPESFHVVILDNGRSRLVGGPFQDMLRCIKCGACLFHCPVYASVGGHAYGSVYQGPMGAVLTPHLVGLPAARHLPSASSLCGRCEAVCPVRIPIPRMLRRLRERSHSECLSPLPERWAGRGLGMDRAAPPGSIASGPVSSRAFSAPPPTVGAVAAAAACRGAGRPGGTFRRPRGRPSWISGGGPGATRHECSCPPFSAVSAAISGGAMPERVPSKNGLARRLAGPRPRRVELSHRDRVDLFVAMAEEADATVARVESLDEAPGAVAGYLAVRNLPARLVVAPDARLDGAPWESRVDAGGSPGRRRRDGRRVGHAGLRRDRRDRHRDGRVRQGHADHPELPAREPMWSSFANARSWAPTRTLGGCSANGPRRPGGPEPSMPRTVNFITGPSRTADIAMTLYLGAHGPRRFHIVLVGDGDER